MKSVCTTPSQHHHKNHKSVHRNAILLGGMHLTGGKPDHLEGSRCFSHFHGMHPAGESPTVFSNTMKKGVMSVVFDGQKYQQ
jgi:hypothetical protein